ncbi:MAG: lytic transglycosylase domain-containing protein [Spirochaetota bacterium]|jgi:soluble lytic murein transglycosylase|nr:lytic transglycosylase domain-containing protein [Spirochaetota bacterium]
MIGICRYSFFVFLFFVFISGNACAREKSEAIRLHNADAAADLFRYFSEHTVPADKREAFVAGKLFHARKDWAPAEQHLRNAADANDGWRDEALFLLADVCGQLGKTNEQEECLQTIARHASGGSFYPRALDRVIQIRLARGETIPARELAPAASFTEIAARNTGQYLLAAAKQSEKDDAAAAREYLVRALCLPPGEGWGEAIVDTGLEWASRGQLVPNDILDLASALTTLKRDKEALAQLSQLEQKSLDPALRARLLDIRCWLERRMRAWDRCAATIADLDLLAAQNPGSDMRFTSMRLRFLLNQARGDFNGQLAAARTMRAENWADAAIWRRALIADCKEIHQRMALALEYLDIWKNDFAIEQKLRDDVIALWLENKPEIALAMTEKALDRIQDHGLRSALVYFRSLAKNTEAGAAILEAPLGLYHYHLRNLPPNDKIAAEALETNCSWQRMASLSFLASPDMRETIFTAMRSRFSTLPDRELLLLSDEIDFDVLAAILPVSAHKVFKQLVRAELWPEALAEITRRFSPGGTVLTQQAPKTLAMLARLAARGAQYNVELWCYYRVLLSCGWQNNLAAVERACGQTIFPRLYPRHYDALIRYWSEYFALDPDLVFALTRQESAFARRIGSWAGAQGLMQLMPATAEGTAKSLKMAKYDLFNPNDNIRLGCGVLAWLTKTYPSDPASVLIGYNAGAGNISRWKTAYRAQYGKEASLDRLSETIPYRETKDYIRLVLSGYMVYKYLGENENTY